MLSRAYGGRVGRHYLLLRLVRFVGKTRGRGVCEVAARLAPTWPASRRSQLGAHSPWRSTFWAELGSAVPHQPQGAQESRSLEGWRGLLGGGRLAVRFVPRSGRTIRTADALGRRRGRPAGYGGLAGPMSRSSS